MARILIAYLCLLCLVEVCIMQVKVRKVLLKDKPSLRRDETEDHKTIDEKATQLVSGLGNITYNFADRKPGFNHKNCVCSQIYDPICASNEKSYFNICQMECDVGKNSNVTVLHQGNCIPF